MTRYQAKLNEIMQNNFDGCSTPQILDALFQMGVIDNSTLKILVVRKFVMDLVKKGDSKLDAMWQATEIFACSYEYVRKCMYYYKDINICSKSV